MKLTELAMPLNSAAVIEFDCDRSLAVVTDKELVVGSFEVNQKIEVHWGKSKKLFKCLVLSVSDNRKSAENSLKMLQKTRTTWSSYLSSQAMPQPSQESEAENTQAAKEKEKTSRSKSNDEEQSEVLKLKRRINQLEDELSKSTIFNFNR